MLRTLLLLAPLLPVPLALGEMRLQGRRDDDDDLQSTLFTPNKRRRAMQRGWWPWAVSMTTVVDDEQG